MSYMGRDIEIVPLDETTCIVAACDSCGAVGSKEMDLVKVSEYIVGRFTARVALLEIIAVQAKPVLLTVTAANEPNPTVTGILEGVKDELKALNLGDIRLVISSEKNMNTKQTGLGISAVGACQRTALRIGTTQPQDSLFCLGLPKVGSEVKEPDDPEIINGNDIRQLLALPGVHDVIPVGSRGILGEVKELAEGLNCGFERCPDANIDCEKSAGPSTCLIFSCSPDYTPVLPSSSAPLTKIGNLNGGL